MLIGFIVIGGSLIITSFRLKSISANKEESVVYIFDYFRKKKVSIDKIEKVKRHFIWFYFLIYSENGCINKAKFLPRYFEIMSSLGGKTKSIIEFEKMLKNSKLKS